MDTKLEEGEQRAFLAACLAEGPTTWIADIHPGLPIVDTGREERICRIFNSMIVDVDVRIIGSTLLSGPFQDQMPGSMYIDFKRLVIIITMPDEPDYLQTLAVKTMIGYQWIGNNSVWIKFDHGDLELVGQGLHYLIAILTLHALERFELFRVVCDSRGIKDAEPYHLHPVSSPLRGFRTSMGRPQLSPHVGPAPDSSLVLLLDPARQHALDAHSRRHFTQMRWIYSETQQLLVRHGFSIPNINDDDDDDLLQEVDLLSEL